MCLGSRTSQRHPWRHPALGTWAPLPHEPNQKPCADEIWRSSRKDSSLFHLKHQNSTGSKSIKQEPLCQDTSFTGGFWKINVRSTCWSASLDSISSMTNKNMHICNATLCPPACEVAVDLKKMTTYSRQTRTWSRLNNHLLQSSSAKTQMACCHSLTFHELFGKR